MTRLSSKVHSLDLESPKQEDADGASSTKTNNETEKDFRDFLDKRHNKKQLLYSIVVSRGFTAYAIGFIISMLGFFGWAFSDPTSYVSLVSNTVTAIGCGVYSLGQCAVSTVPTYEFDVDKYLERHPIPRRCLKLFVNIFGIIFGILTLNSPPYFGGFLIVIFSILLILPVPIAVSLRLYALLVSALLFGFTPNIIYAIGPEFTKNHYLYNNVNSLTFWDYCNGSNRGLIISAYLVTYANWAFWGVLSVISFYVNRPKGTEDTEDSEGWRTSVLYSAMYCYSFGTAFYYLITVVFGLAIGFYPSTWSVILPNALIVIFLLSPLLPVVIFGRAWCFSYVARVFENNLDQLISDGALMASLAAKSQHSDKSIWIQRKTESEEPKPINTNNEEHHNAIARYRWIKGTINGDPKKGKSDCEKKIKRIFNVSVSYLEDIDSSWQCCFQNASYLVVRSCTELSAFSTVSADTFKAWCISNFGSASVSEPGDGSGQVVSSVDKDAYMIVLEHTIVSTESSKESLEEWSRNNLRKFEWCRGDGKDIKDNFTDDLLMKSPRELHSLKEKEDAWSRSTEAKVHSNADKIDFFISHSWIDEPSLKIVRLKEFVEKFHAANKRYPTFWLDKVCIDQANPGDALSCIPINIGFCHKVLVILSESYFKRLWCIWELICLFTFCNKELAMERVEFLFLDESHEKLIKVLEEFDIDNAHCYDPNEEFKLRCILDCIGISRIRRTMKEVAMVCRKRIPHKKNEEKTSYLLR